MPLLTTSQEMHRLLVFTAVARTGSFTRAAEELGITKSVVSQHVLRLEQRLEVALLQRTTRRVSLTDAGRELYESTAAIFRQLEDLGDRMDRTRSAPTGRITLTATHDFTLDNLAPLLARFTQRYPAIEISLVTTDHVLDLVEHRLDLAIRVGWLTDSSMHARLLCGFEQVICASPAYMARVGEVTRPADLAKVDWVSLSLLKTPRRWTLRSAGGAEQTVQTRGQLTANGALTVRSLLLGGAGVSVLPDYLVRHDLHGGGLVRLLADFTLPRGGVYAVLPSRKRVPARVGALVDFLRAELRTVRE
jgi:DNA-binding transcriptional LysR family regulator